MDYPTTFEVTNTRTWIHYAPPWLLSAIDQVTSYPTETALALESGFRPPDSDGWDGWVRLLHKPKRSSPWLLTGLLPYCQQACRRLQVEYRVDDRRERPMEGLPERWEPIPLWAHQLEAADRAENAGRGVLDMPPRAGKTRAGLEIHRRIALPTLWIAPTDGIVTQTLEVATEWFGKYHAAHQVGGKVDETMMHMPLVICTAATAVMLSKAFYKTREVLFVDEFHRAAAKTYRKISELAAHVYFRFGMTGTFFRSGYDALAMHGILSTPVYSIGTAKLIELGKLVPTRVLFLRFNSRKLRGCTGPGELFKYGIAAHEERNRLVVEATAILAHQGRKVLVLVRTKAQGREIQRLLEGRVGRKSSRAQHSPVEYVSTDRPRPSIRAALEAFRESDAVRVLIGTSLVGEGIDLPPADALVYAMGGKAEVSLMQSAFRVATAVEEKRDAVLVDFADPHHRRLHEHAQERLRIYHGEPLFNVSVVGDLRALARHARDGSELSGVIAG